MINKQKLSVEYGNLAPIYYDNLDFIYALKYYTKSFEYNNNNIITN